MQTKHDIPFKLKTVNAQNNNTFKNKRELILSVLDQSKPNAYVPAAFFLHFDHKLGAKAVQDHVNFFRATNMDIVKIQYEIVVPRLDIKAARQRGADGFYISSQGGDDKTFGKTKVFTEYVRPFDKKISEVANEIAPVNILHICDYGSSYGTIDDYTDYPASIINPPIHVGKGSLDLKHVAEVFKRPVFGGLDRLGVIANGSLEEAKAAVDKVLENAPDNFILGADCTVPSSTDYDKLRAVIDYAHNWRSTHQKK